MGTNKESFHGMETAENPTGTVSNGSELDSDLTAEMNDVGCVPFHEDGIVNSFGMNDLMERGFQVHMDSAEENCIFVEKDDIVGKFITSDSGLCFHDLWNNNSCFKKSNDNFSIKNNVFMQLQKKTANGTQKGKLTKQRKLKTCVK